ncbi:MAG: histidine phosphatase family protein, partial [Pseudomonadota bacterium]
LRKALSAYDREVMRILLARHGHTNFNELGLCNADPKVEVFLTKKGIEQAESLKGCLEKYSIQKVYVSDLPRTSETARYCVPNHDSIIQDDRLSDIKTGFENRPVQDFLDFIKANPLSIKTPGGESFYDVKARVHSFIDTLVQSGDDCVLIITHMDPAKIITGFFQEFTDSEVWNLEIDNCTLLEFHAS